jgi:hypothetical protein
MYAFPDAQIPFSWETNSQTDPLFSILGRSNCVEHRTKIVSRVTSNAASIFHLRTIREQPLPTWLFLKKATLR